MLDGHNMMQRSEFLERLVAMKIGEGYSTTYHPETRGEICKHVHNRDMADLAGKSRYCHVMGIITRDPLKDFIVAVQNEFQKREDLIVTYFMWYVGVWAILSAPDDLRQRITEIGESVNGRFNDGWPHAFQKPSDNTRFMFVYRSKAPKKVVAVTKGMPDEAFPLRSDNPHTSIRVLTMKDSAGAVLLARTKEVFKPTVIDDIFRPHK
jgi:hypothetical protein